jgi:hypothetical protein
MITIAVPRYVIQIFHVLSMKWVVKPMKNVLMAAIVIQLLIYALISMNV